MTRRPILTALALGLSAAALMAAPASAHRCEANSGIWNDTQMSADVESALRTAFNSCMDGVGDSLAGRAACSGYVARALETGWDISDFNVSGTYLDQSAIAQWFGSVDRPGWDNLGSAASQAALDAAAARAAGGDAVLAVYSGGDEKHVALILPGGVAASSGWEMAKVPRAVNLPADSAANAFFGCRLSWGYSGGKAGDITFFAKASGSKSTVAAPAAPAEPEAPVEPTAPEEPAEPASPPAPPSPEAPPAPVTEPSEEEAPEPNEG